MENSFDVSRLRELGKAVFEIVESDINKRRLDAYKAVNSLKLIPPPVHFVPPPPPNKAIEELFELEDCQIEDPFLRKYEAQLLQILRREKKLGDDQPTPGIIYSGFEHSISGWMDNAKYNHFTTLGHGAATPKSFFEPCLNSESDFEKMHYPELTCDKEKTQYNYERLAEIFNGVLPVRIGVPYNGVTGWGENLISEYVVLRGLEQTYYDFIDNPEFIHKVMKFLLEGKKRIWDERVKQNMLSLNNTGMRISSCSPGYTDELPAPGFDSGHIRKCDLWGHSNAQELSEVSPRMLEEFVMPYEKELLNGFGLLCYGCCEPMEYKIEVAERHLKNLRMVSINPFTNYAMAAEQCRGKYVYAWKPSSAYMVNFDEEENRRYLKESLSLMKGCCVTITLEDTYSYGNDLTRFKRWVQIAHDVIQELY